MRALAFTQRIVEQASNNGWDFAHNDEPWTTEQPTVEPGSRLQVRSPMAADLFRWYGQPGEYFSTAFARFSDDVGPSRALNENYKAARKAAVVYTIHLDENGNLKGRRAVDLWNVTWSLQNILDKVSQTSQASTLRSIPEAREHRAASRRLEYAEEELAEAQKFVDEAQAIHRLAETALQEAEKEKCSKAPWIPGFLQMPEMKPPVSSNHECEICQTRNELTVD